MSTPLILLCPGQGAQAVGMGKAWHAAAPEARDVFERADLVLGSRLGMTLTDLCFSGPAERLNQTDVSQPAIYVCSVASWRGMLAGWGLAENDVVLAGAAGLSLGEYTALHLAGAISFEEGLELVTLRGRAMQDAAEAVPSGMVALIGADEAQARAVCDAALSGENGGGGGSEVLVAANFNVPGQVVLSGHKAACERAAGEAQKLGLRATPLPVAGAFHSPLMAPAAARLKAALARTTIREPRCPVMSNVTGLPHQASPDITMKAGTAGPDAIRQRLVDQLTMPVRWEACCRWLAGNTGGQVGSDVHELAPGKTLAGLMRRIDKAVKVVSHDEPGQA